MGFMIMLYAPLEIVFNNQSDFWFDMWELLQWIGPVALMSIFIGIMILFLLSRINIFIFKVVSAGLWIAYICMYIQGNFLVGNLPLLDGSDIPWNQYPMDRIKSIIVWLLVIFFVIFIIKKRGFTFFARLGKTISIFIVLILGITLGFLCISTKAYERKSTICVTDKGLWDYSRESNFIIFVLDSVNGQEVNNLIHSDDGQEYEKMLKDFTFYYNMQGAYPFTGNSSAFILSGEWYENDMSSKSYFHKAYTNSVLLDELDIRNYDKGLYLDGLNNMDEDYYLYENIMSSKADESMKGIIVKSVMRIVGMKYLPFDLKRLCINNKKFNTEKYLKMLIPEEDSANIFDPDNKVFLEQMNQASIQYSNKKQFKYIHIDGAHAPFQYNINVEKIKDATYQTSVEASMTIVDQYLNKLKKAGVYDNSIIIIMADHGYDNSSDEIINSYFYRQNPMFFVKGINENHSLMQSKAPVSFVDLNLCYRRLLDGNRGTDVFDYKEGDNRIRRWLYYEGGNGPIIEYEQSEEAWRRETLYATGREYLYK